MHLVPRVTIAFNIRFGLNPSPGVYSKLTHAKLLSLDAALLNCSLLFGTQVVLMVEALRIFVPSSGLCTWQWS